MIFPLDLDPFPHAVGVVAPFDEMDIIWLPEGKENVQVRLTAREFMAKMPPARQFVEYHTSTNFLRRIFDAYGEVIYRMYPRLKDLPLEACIRGGDAPYQLDCQFAVNTPNTVRSRVVGPHIDNPKELYAFLVYCGDGEGSLELRSWNRSPRFYGKSHARDEDCPVFKVVPYRQGNVAFFINSPYSVHSVGPRLSSEYRKYINIICEVNFPLFEIPRAEDDPYPGTDWCPRGIA